MEARTRNRPHRQPRRRVPGGKRKRSALTAAHAALPDIVCRYGVVVQRTLIPGMELIEFEFPVDAA